MQTDILPTPGSLEATAIREDYTAALSGLRRFVSMGFRLMDVKERLPHGKFLSWCDKHLGDLSRRHLYRARYIAEGINEMTGLKCDTRVPFENLPPEIEELIDGTSSLRALLGNIQEYRHDQAEEDAKAKCEEKFQLYPDIRDDWEPRVLSGELNWCQAVRGIIGQELTLGKPRRDPNYNVLSVSSFTTLCEAFKRWENIRPEIQTRLLEDLNSAAPTWPQEVINAINAARR